MSATDEHRLADAASDVTIKFSSHLMSIDREWKSMANDSLLPEPRLSLEGDIIVMTMLLLLALAIVVGNLLVITFSLTAQCLHMSISVFILSLAVADFSVGLFVIPMGAFHAGFGHWPFGAFHCLTWSAVDVLASTSSIIHLCVISLERYFAVSKPLVSLRYRKRKILIMVAICVWAISILISVPLLVFAPPTTDEEKMECHFTRNPLYLIVSSLISFYLPFFVMLVVYLRIYRVIRKRLGTFRKGFLAVRNNDGSSGMMRVHRGGIVPTALPSTTRQASLASNIFPEARPTTQRGTDSSPFLISTFKPPNKPTTIPLRRFEGSATRMNNSTIAESNAVDDTQSSAGDTITSPQTILPMLTSLLSSPIFNNSNRELRREIKAAIMFAVIFGTFVICWLPFFLVNLINGISLLIDPSNQGMLDSLFVYTSWLGYVNSLANPLIYALAFRKFRVFSTCCSGHPGRQSNTRTALGLSSPSRLGVTVHNSNSLVNHGSWSFPAVTDGGHNDKANVEAQNLSDVASISCSEQFEMTTKPN